MSLHQLAQTVQSRGRGDDTVLMHVTPGEIGGLQSLAMKHGGSLTINPETGLPEAGILKNILPTLLGVGLSFVPGVGPLMAAGIVGGGTALATGSLQKGLMAGLGAYGGAGMGAGLASLGGAGAGAASSVTPLATGASTVGAPALGGSMMAQPAASTLGSGFTNAAPNLVSSPLTDAIKASTNTLTAANQALKIPATATMGSNFAAAGRGLKTATSGLEGLKAAQGAIGAAAPYSTAITGASLLHGMRKDPAEPEKQKSLIRPYEYERTQNPQAYAPSAPVYGQPFDSSERNYFTDKYTALTPYEAPGPEYMKASGGVVAFQEGGPIGNMSAMNTMGVGAPYPQSRINTPSYSTSGMQAPMGEEVLSSSMDVAVNPYTGEQQRFADGGGVSSLGDYSDGGRLLKGPGDGVSDSIPAVIGNRQPARLADGEFVIPARIVSELGNGSTDAGAKKLYAMMERIQSARKKSIGKGKVAANTRSERLLPA